MTELMHLFGISRFISVGVLRKRAEPQTECFENGQFCEECLNRQELIRKVISMPSKNFVKFARALGKREGELALGNLAYETKIKFWFDGEPDITWHESTPKSIEMIGEIANNYNGVWNYLGPNPTVPPVFESIAILGHDDNKEGEYTSDLTRAVRNVVDYENVGLEMVKVEHSNDLKQKIRLENNEFAKRFPVSPLRPLTIPEIKRHAAQTTRFTVYVNERAIVDYAAARTGDDGVRSILKGLNREDLLRTLNRA